MDPAEVHVGDGGVRRRGVLFAGLGAVFALLSTAVAAVVTDATPGDLAPFAAAVLGAAACWLVAHVIAAARRTSRERHAVDEFFAGPIWEHWSYSPDEWRTIVDRDHPDDPPIDEWNWGDHLVTFGGLGLVGSTVVLLAGVFGFDDPDVTPVVVVVAATLFVVMIGAAIAQPFYLRRVHHERRAGLLAVTDPGVWFGPHAIYHHELGFVRLEPLAAVHDDTAHRHAPAGSLPRASTQHVLRGDGSVVFTIARPPGRRGGLDDLPPLPARVVHVDVPMAARDRARELVARYHRGRPELGD